MENKVLLILADGMRPDALRNISHPFAREFMQNSSTFLEARTVMPSVTLPCHFSLVLSATPQRHGILTNTYVPQVRPIEGIFEKIKSAGKTSCFVYDWEELRDLSRPGAITYSHMLNVGGLGDDYLFTCKENTEKTIECIEKFSPDFMFFYIGLPDEMGHQFGWMGENYINCLNNVWDAVERVVSSLPENYSVIITADHGGHAQTHGTDADEDMYIPIILHGPAFKGTALKCPPSILDIAPTVADILSVPKDAAWEGKSLV